MKKVILYLGGGALAGIFGAGFVSALKERHLESKIDKIYAGSAGVFNAAYFLSGQTKLGTSIYFDLTEKFISPKNVFFGSWDRFLNKLFGNPPVEKVRNVLDINYLMDIAQNKKRLDISKLSKNKLKLYAKLINTKTGRYHYFKVNENNAFKILKASSSANPYFYSHERFMGQVYTDAISTDPLDLNYLLEKYPHHKIVVVMNLDINRRFRQGVKSFVEGLVASFMYEKNLFSHFASRESNLKRALNEAINNQRVLLIHPPDYLNVRPNLSNSRDLEKVFLAGKKEVLKFSKFIQA